MPYVDLYSRSYSDPSAPGVRNMPQWNCRELPFDFAIDSSTDGQTTGNKLYVGAVPSHARISYASPMKNTAITGLTDIDFGDESNPDGLIDGMSLASASNVGKQLFPAQFPNGDADAPLWELLGYTEDPKRDIILFFTLNADPTADGVLEGSLKYSVPI